MNTINPLSLDDLMARKDEVVEAHNDAMNDLEQKYFSDVTQLYRIKQAMQRQLQTSLMDSLHEINNMIKQKMRGGGSVGPPSGPTSVLGANNNHNHNNHNNHNNRAGSVISISSSSQQSTNSHFHHNGHSHNFNNNNRQQNHQQNRNDSSNPLLNPPTFSRPLPISSMPQIEAPTVPLSTSIDAILHKKQSQQKKSSLIPPPPPPRKNKRKRKRTNSNYNKNLNSFIDSDPMSLDFNLVTVPDDTLNDVRSIVANNATKLNSNNNSPSYHNHNNNHNNNHNKNHKKDKNKNKNKKRKSSIDCNSNNSNSNNQTSPSIEPSLGPTTVIKEDDGDGDGDGEMKEKIKGEQDVKDIKPDTKDFKPDTVECNLCHQAFDTQKNLRAHINKAHTFKCDLCAKSFQKRIDLKRHQRLHEGVTVYEWYVFCLYFHWFFLL